MKLVSVGCSFTEGQGVKPNKTYTHLLSKLINCTYKNYGRAGHSNKYVFRKTIELLKNWNSNDILIVQWTNPNRDEIVTNEGYLFYPPFTTFFSLEFLYNNDTLVFDLKKDGIDDKSAFEKEVVNKKEKLVETYCNEFYNEKYQYDMSFAFQLALHAILEKMNVKYIMFFGWQFAESNKYETVLPFVNEKFIKETFAEYTNTNTPEHPSVEGHMEWSKLLFDKFKKFNYI